ncbi:hypothetical protein HZB60_02550 [candidate division KSB1 bacterium]|nr:hypothetical protein [candidate division KSB1 bacterium]
MQIRNLFCLLLCAATCTAQVQQFNPAGIGGGGGLFYPALSPQDSAEFHLACDMGEFFQSSDAGVSWQVPSFRELRSSDRGRVKYSGDPLVRYALSGGDVMGLHKTTDGGNDWFPVVADPTGGEAYGLAVAVNSSNRLVVSDYSSVYYSGNGGSTFSTLASNGGGLHLAGAAFLGDTIYVATGSGLFSSANGGSSFVPLNLPGIPAGQTYLSFCGARQGATVRLFCIVAAVADVYPGIGGADYGIFSGLYTWTSGDASWTQRTAGIQGGDRLFYIDCAVDSVEMAYAAGASISSYNPIVLKTTNGGTAWQSVFLTTNNQNITTGWCGDHGDVNWGWAECPLGFSVCATAPQRVLITDYGFAHLSTDGGASWRQVYLDPATSNPAGSQTPRYQAYSSNGLEPTSVWQLLWVDSLRMIASFTDIRGVRSTDGGTSWSRLKLDTLGTFGVNTVYHTIKHPVSGLLYAATSSVHDLYESTYLTDGSMDGGRGQLWYSGDFGATWSVLHDFLHPVIWVASDPTNPARLYCSVVHSTLGGIYVTNNLPDGPAATWTRLSAPPRTQGHAFNIHVLNDGTLLATYSARRAGSPLAFTPSAGVFYSTNGGTSWLDRSDPMMIYWTKDLVIDPHDPLQDSWFVTVRRGWGGPPNELGGLFRTTDRGANWTRISDQLYAESCRISPLDSNAAYLSTSESGLWYSSNVRAALPTFTELTAFPFAHPSRIFYNPADPGEVWFGSFGNGLRYGSAASPPPAVSDLTAIFAAGQLLLRWSATAGAQSYRIYGSPDAAFGSLTLLGTTSSTEYALPTPDDRYFYYVTASDAP